MFITQSAATFKATTDKVSGCDAARGKKKRKKEN